ncbi:helix-turn-helix domain-containing protein [Cohnella sp. JJ-181]|uniref:helix-turn-helix domain-containing protein n=1 Tax=Cohnella rhizoplanae TaxID=2974897 RepID=UPI0022FFB146|nr:helix-turn-helix domain-containing protein [Cohnella sp. JJ-181]CAI6018240.1 HTH-type transcriptional activator RhaR [Cohnella sp. JJ-181]
MTLLRNLNQRKSIFATLLISYIAILLIPVAIGAFLYQRVEHIMADNANRTNLGLLDQVKLVAENRFAEVDSLSVQLSFNPKLQWALSNYENDYTKSQFNLVEIMKDFRNVNKVSSFIDNFFVYFKNTDSVLTTAGKYDSPFFFSKILKFQDQNVDWVKRNLLAGNPDTTYLPVSSIKEGERTSSVITYVQSLPIGEKVNVKGYLVVFIKEQEFDHLIAQIEKVNKSSISIVNDKQQIIMTTDKSRQLSPKLLAKLDGQSGYDDNAFAQDGKAMMLSYTTGQNGWKYVSVVPKKMVLAQVTVVKNMALMLLFLCLVAGIVAAYAMAYRNYSPIRDVVRTIMQDNNDTQRNDNNEYDYIKQSILRSLGEKNQLRQTLTQQAPVIQANFLSRLIKGHIEASSVQDDAFKFMGLQFEHEYFGVILLEIEDCREWLKEDTEREWANVRLILSDLSIGLLEGRGYIVELDRNRLAILTNTPLPSEHTYRERTAFIEQLLEAAGQRLPIKITTAVSQYHRGAEEIGKCYREALFALDYRMIKGANTVIYHEEIANLEQQSYHYPLESEVQLMNFAKSGDYASAERLLDQTYEANFQSNGISPEMGKFLMIDLLSTLVKVMNGLPLSDKKRLESKIDPVKVIAEYATAEDMMNQIKASYRLICKFTKEEKTEHGDRLHARICHYINEHYDDSGLSLSLMADHFQISLQYLSTFFKKHSGQNITDYIAAVRIRRAKELLADSSITMGDIAVKIGYANAVSFVRFFKKAEGVPPGKYRELLERHGASIPEAAENG